MTFCARLTGTLTAGALLALSAPLTAQSATIEFFGPGNAQAIQFSPDGEWVAGIAGATPFRWSEATGFEALPGGTEAWDITDDGFIVAGAGSAGGPPEAAVWMDGSGWDYKGNAGGATGCDSFLSNFFTLDDSGTIAGGMSWQGCQTTALAWTASGGLQLLPEEVASHSSRVNAISGNGLRFGGWETANSGVRRAAVWPSITSAPVFILAGPGNPDGAGEVTDMNSDGTRVCGSSGNAAFTYTLGEGAVILPAPAGIPGSRVANGCSDDGSVVGGVALNFPQLNGWIWTPDTGSVGLFNHLSSLGVTGISAGALRNVTGVSRDGTRLCGWGSNGGFVVTFSDVWEDLGNGLAGTNGVPVLAGEGSLAAGSALELTLTDAANSAAVGLFVGFTQIDAPFKGGVLVPSPDILVTPLMTDATGELVLASTWPAGVPSGFEIYLQDWIVDAAGPNGFAASNGLLGTTP